MQQTDDCACSDAKIAVRDLTKMYGDLTVLDKVNFTIKRGELVCIVGPTGCGKTTFLNCMSKLTETTSGNIYIDGEVANPRKHNLAFVFQETKYVVATRALVLLSLVVGLVGGIYGIGGGAIMAPFLVSFFGLPVYVVAGSTLFATFVTSVAGVSFYALLAPFYPDMAVAPDWRMGVLVGLGGMCGMYAGARCQKFVPSIALKALLTAVLLFTAVRYLGQGF